MQKRRTPSPRHPGSRTSSPSSSCTGRDPCRCRPPRPRKPWARRRYRLRPERRHCQPHTLRSERKETETTYTAHARVHNLERLQLALILGRDVLAAHRVVVRVAPVARRHQDVRERDDGLVRPADDAARAESRVVVRQFAVVGIAAGRGRLLGHDRRRLVRFLSGRLLRLDFRLWLGLLDFRFGLVLLGGRLLVRRRRGVHGSGCGGRGRG